MQESLIMWKKFYESSRKLKKDEKLGKRARDTKNNAKKFQKIEERIKRYKNHNKVQKSTKITEKY